MNAFVFLDNPLGLSTGREVHGWPKALAEITDEGEVTVVADDGSGRLRPKPLLAIERTPWQPLRAFAPAIGSPASRLGGRCVGGGQSLIEGCRAYRAAAVSLAGVPGSRPEHGHHHAQAIRDVEQPSRSAYQAVIHSVMEAQSLKDLRLLAPLETAWGDLSGGFRVRFHRTASYPMVDLLGIEVEPAGTGVFSARPTVPFALDLDIRYGAGRVLGERREDRPAPYVEISAGSLEALPGPLTANELVLQCWSCRRTAAPGGGV